MMKIVPVKEIPANFENVPTEDLMEVYKVCQEMESVCLEEEGIGLSAAQVGIPWRLFIYWSNYPRKPKQFSYMVNCEYEPVGDEKYMSIEGCLSLKAQGRMRVFKLYRYGSVRVQGKQLLSKNELELVNFDQVFSGDIFSSVVQHEIDHHHGILISDFGEEIDLIKKEQ